MSTQEANTLSTSRYLSFSLGGEAYAIPLLGVKEVIALPEITPVPFCSPYFLGIMNLRGQVIAVVDLRIRFNMKTDRSTETAVIICDLEHASVGVVVDSIDAVLNPPQSEISPKPELQGHRTAEYITGVYRKDKKLVLLMNIARILTPEDMKHVQRPDSPRKAA